MQGAARSHCGSSIGSVATQQTPSRRAIRRTGRAFGDHKSRVEPENPKSFTKRRPKRRTTKLSIGSDWTVFVGSGESTPAGRMRLLETALAAISQDAAELMPEASISTFLGAVARNC